MSHTTKRASSRFLTFDSFVCALYGEYQKRIGSSKTALNQVFGKKSEQHVIEAPERVCVGYGAMSLTSHLTTEQSQDQVISCGRQQVAGGSPPLTREGCQV